MRPFGDYGSIFGAVQLLLLVHPKEAKVLQLIGKYVGSTHEPGLRWANPSYAKVPVSTRVRKG